MITIDNKIYRNIQEQVEYLTKKYEDIEAGGQVIAEYGIHVIGIVTTAGDLPTEGNKVGDAYLVGESSPYDVYIYTAGTTNDFINVGPLSSVGPQGPKGEIGPAGADGYAPVVRYGAGLPVVESTDKDGYLYINTSTDQLFTFNNNQWHFVINMKGAKGDRGAQGIQGATGTTLSIVGKLSSPSLLPTNFQTGAIPKNSAYLVDVQGANHLYIILGQQDDYSTWYWHDAGDFNLGSILYDDTGAFIYYKNVTDEYDTDTGSLVTDIATNALYEELSSIIADKVDGQEFTEAITSKASITTTNVLADQIDGIITDINTNYLAKDDAADTYIAKESTNQQIITNTNTGGEVFGVDNNSSASHTWLRFKGNGSNIGEFGVKKDDGTPRYYNNKQSKSYTICLDAGNYSSPAVGTNSYIKLGQWVILFGRAGAYQAGGGIRTYTATFPVTMADTNYFVMMTNDCNTSDITNYPTSGNYGCYDRTVNGCTFKINYSASNSRGVDYIIIGRVAATA